MEEATRRLDELTRIAQERVQATAKAALDQISASASAEAERGATLTDRPSNYLQHEFWRLRAGIYEIEGAEGYNLDIGPSWLSKALAAAAAASSAGAKATEDNQLNDVAELENLYRRS